MLEHVLIGAALASGGWEDERSVVQDPVFQHRSATAAAPDDTLHVAWLDWTDWEDTKVVLTSSTDRGVTWTDPATIFAGFAYDDLALHADAAGLHLVAMEFSEDEENENKRPYYVRSVDGGQTFTEPVRIGTRNNIEASKLFSGPGRLYFYGKNWTDESEDDYLYVSEDDGATWMEKPINVGPALRNACFTVHGGVIHLVTAGIPNILHATSSDAGDAWSGAVAVSSGAGPHAQLPQVAVESAQVIHVAWEDDREDHFNVLYARSTDGGATWTDDVRLNDTFYGARAKILAAGDGVHLLWCQYHGDDGWPSTWSSADYGIIWHRASMDSGKTWTDELRVSQNEAIPPIDLPDNGANHVKIAVYSDGFAAIWQDKRDGNVDIYLRNRFVIGCPGDVDGCGVVDFADLLAVLSSWGPCEDCPADVNNDDIVDFDDLLIVLSNWGPCT